MDDWRRWSDRGVEGSLRRSRVPAPTEVRRAASGLTHTARVNMLGRGSCPSPISGPGEIIDVGMMVRHLRGMPQVVRAAPEAKAEWPLDQASNHLDGPHGRDLPRPHSIGSLTRRSLTHVV